MFNKLKKTPIIKIDNAFFKREDLNPSGSVKDRAVLSQLSWLKKNELNKAAISSSGNSAISALYWGKKMGIEITVFVSPKINKAKLTKLRKLKGKIIITKKPISQCFRLCQAESIYNLKQSQDKKAREGFELLGKEIYAQLGMPQSIFFPVSSGTTLLGVSDFFKKSGKIPKLFLVQSAAHCPLASQFDKNFYPEKSNITDALVAKYIPKKEEILKIIKQSKGTGIVVQTKEILRAHDWLKSKNILTSYEGALALAGFWKIKNKIDIDKPLCLLTGKYYKNEKN